MTTIKERTLPKVQVRSYSTVNGWSTAGGDEVIAWTFLPPPWNGEQYSRNPYFDPDKVQDRFEQSVREQLARQAELIRQRKEQNEHKGDDL